MTEILEEYKEFQIHINRVPETQFEFNGFGWAYQISNENKLAFKLVVKAPRGRDKSENIKFLYQWGLKTVTQLIDTNEFIAGETYCYSRYESDRSIPPRKINCEGFLRE